MSALTSALHARRITKFTKGNATYVCVFIHRARRKKKPEIECIAPVVGEREAKNSGAPASVAYWPGQD